MNQVKRRLAEIDRELSLSPAYYLNQTITTAPLVFCALGLIAGIVIQDCLPVPLWFWLSLLSSCILITAISFRNRPWLFPITVVLCFACLGAIRLASFVKPALNDIRNSVSDEPTLATIRGMIETKPYMDSNNWAFSKFAHIDRGSSFYLKVTEAESTAGWAKASGLVRVRVQEPVLDLAPGDRVQMYCTLDRFASASNPGEFDIAKYLARKGVFIGASVKSKDAIETLEPGNTGLFTRTRAALQGFAIRTLLGSLYPKDEEEGLLLALVLGHRANIDPETTEAFRRTGLLHFICLSGMNFAMVIGFVWWLAKTAGIMKPARAAVCMLSAVLFLLVVPDNAPAFRAAVMCFAFCGAFIFRRNSNPFNSLALAAIVLLFISPAGLFEPDWQLTFISVLGILLFCPRFFMVIREKTIDHPWLIDFVKTRPFLSIGTKPWPYAIFSTSFTAWLSTVGITLYHFGTIQLLTSFYTVLVSPLIGLVSILGYLKLAIGLFSPSISAVMGIFTNFLADWLIWIVKLLASLDISEILIGKTAISVIILYYALVIYAGFFNFNYRLIKRAVLATGISSLAFILLLPTFQGLRSGLLTITALDAGHGQAVLAQLPDGANILFDAGSLSRDNIGARVVSPFLKYNRLKKIDAIIVSHGDIDHINGIPEVIRDTQTQAVFASEVFLNDARPTVQFLRDQLRQNDIEPKPVTDKFRTSGDVNVTILWPVKNILNDNQISDNDKSIVTLIEYAGRRILFASDVEKFAQAEILRLYPDLKTDVLIAPHHGSKKTLSWEFLQALQPQVVISSCTRSAFDKGQVVKRGDNYHSFYTGKNGAVIIRINENGDIEITPFRINK